MSRSDKNYSELLDAWRRLQEQWRHVADRWHDRQKSRFEKEYWQKFEEIVPDTTEEMDKLRQLILKIRRNTP